MQKPKNYFMAAVASLYGSCLMVGPLVSNFYKEIVFTFPLAVALVFMLVRFCVPKNKIQGVSSIIYVIYFAAIAMGYIYVITSFVGTYVLPQTPRLLFAALLTLICVYAAHKGYKNILSLGVIFFAVAIISYTANGFLLRDKVNLGSFLPVTLTGKNFLLSFLLSFLLLLSDASVFMCFFKNKRDVQIFSLGFIAGSIFLYGVICFTIMALSNTLPIFAWPTYQALRTINSGNTLARVETATVFVIYAVMFYKICLVFCALETFLKKIKKIVDKRRRMC